MTPLLAVCGGWCAALSLTVLAAPGQPLLGAVALVLAVITAGISTVVRPLAVGLAVAAALAGIARAELPAADPSLGMRATTMAGLAVVVSGVAADDPKARCRRLRAAPPANGDARLRRAGTGAGR
jgi:hypothetical protein